MARDQSRAGVIVETVVVVVLLDHARRAPRGVDPTCQMRVLNTAYQAVCSGRTSDTVGSVASIRDVLTVADSLTMCRSSGVNPWRVRVRLPHCAQFLSARPLNRQASGRPSGGRKHAPSGSPQTEYRRLPRFQCSSPGWESTIVCLTSDLIGC